MMFLSRTILNIATLNSRNATAPNRAEHFATDYEDKYLVL